MGQTDRIRPAQFQLHREQSRRRFAAAVDRGDAVRRHRTAQCDPAQEVHARAQSAEEDDRLQQLR